MKTGLGDSGLLMATALGILAGSGPVTIAGWTEQDLEAELLPAVVEVRGTAVVMPMFGSETDAPSFYRRPADPPLRIPLRDGEILYVGQDFDEIAGVLVYRHEDGPVLDLWIDGPVLRVAGKAHSLVLEKKEAWDWLASAPLPSLSELRVVCIGIDESKPALVESLGRLVRVNPSVGLFLEDADEALIDALRPFRPKALWMTEEGGPSESEEVDAFCSLIAHWTSLEEVAVGVEGAAPAVLETLAGLPHLRRLTLHGWDPAVSGPMPADFAALVSLTLIDANVEDLSHVSSLYGLHELQLIECTNLTSLRELPWLSELWRLEVREGHQLDDISALGDSPWLRSVILEGCDSVRDLTPLNDVVELDELGFPPQTTLEQFEELVETHPWLMAVHLHGCRQVEDLTVLAGLEWLERLSMDETHDIAMVSALPALQYVALRAEDDGDDESLDPWAAATSLRQSHPNADVNIVGQPFCLGAGQILWLVPVIALQRMRRRSVSSRDD